VAEDVPPQTPPTTDKEKAKAFLAERRKRLAERGRVLRETYFLLQKLLADAEKEIATALAAQPSDYTLWRLTEVRIAIETAQARLAEEGTKILSTGIDSAGAAGVALLDAPLVAGGVHLAGILPRVDLGALIATKVMATDRIKDIAREAAGKIHADLAQVVAGVFDPGTAINRVQEHLQGSARKRALTIVRTEVGAAFSTAAQARFEQAAPHLPGLEKQWRRSGKIHSRMTHDLADGQVVPVDKPFKVGGVSIMYPRAPDIPVGHRVNCGCESLPFMTSWTVLTPGRKAFTEQEITLNPRKRDLEDALSGGFDPEKAVRGMTGATYFEEVQAWVRTERRRGRDFGKLSDAEIVALRAYTGDDADLGGEGKAVFKLLNATLRGNRPDPVVRSFARVLDDALEKLPTYEGWGTRGATLPPEVAAGFIRGGVFQDKGFLSMSTVSGFGGSHAFRIYSRTGHPISDFSHYATENEVLFPSGAKFDILEVYRKGERTYVTMKHIVDKDRLAEALDDAAQSRSETENERLIRESREWAEENEKIVAEGRGDPAVTTTRWLAKGEGLFDQSIR
jgi:hypothetical protein